MRTHLARLLLPCLLFALWVPLARAQGGGFAWQEQAYVTETIPGALEQLGYGISVEGGRVAIGVPQRDSSTSTSTGLVRVMERTGNQWFDTAQLAPASLNAFDLFGRKVALSGDTLAVSAVGDDEGGPGAGAIYVFVHDGIQWSQQAKLMNSAPNSNEGLGHRFTLSGDTVVAGDESPSNFPGRALVFERTGTTWAEAPELTGSNGFVGGDKFGASVSVEGDTLAIGAPWDDAAGFATRTGTVYVYVRSGGTWVEQAVLNADDKAFKDEFGTSVSLSGDLLLVSAPFDDFGIASDSGSAYVFERSGVVWSQQAKLVIADPAKDLHLGETVALSGTTALLGARNDGTSGTDAGAAYVFEGVGSTWTEVDKLFASDRSAGDQFGWNVDVDGDTLMVAAPFNDLGGVTDAGAAYVFANLPDEPSSYCTAGTSASGCQAYLSGFGYASATGPAGFLLAATNVEGGKSGIFFLGTSGTQANAWGSGTSFQCVVPPVIRLGLMTPVGTLGACDGGFSKDLNAHWCPTCPKALQNPGYGALVQAQLWYRDPLNTSNQTTSLSNGLQFSVGP